MNDEFERAYARATLGRFLAELFCEPNDALGARTADAAFARELHGSAEIISLPRELLDALLIPIAPADARAEPYNALFGHSVRGECPLYEMEYIRGEIYQQSHMLADITGFYRAFGLTIDDGRCERADHVAAEWEFLALCALKEAQAGRWLSGLDTPPAGLDVAAAVATCREAQSAFIRDHAATWMPAFFARVQKADPKGFYGRCAAFGEALLRRLCESFDVPYGPEWLELRPFDEEDMAIECGPGREPGQVTLGPGLASAMNGG